jgi:hypothetical protein
VSIIKKEYEEEEEKISKLLLGISGYLFNRKFSVKIDYDQ